MVLVQQQTVSSHLSLDTKLEEQTPRRVDEFGKNHGNFRGNSKHRACDACETIVLANQVSLRSRSAESACDSSEPGGD